MEKENNISYKWKRIFASKTYGSKKLILTPEETQKLIDDIETLIEPKIISNQEVFLNLQSIILKEFNAIDFSKGLEIITEEDLSEKGWEDTYTYVNPSSGEAIDFYPLRITRQGFIQAVNSYYESLNDFNFSDIELRSQIEILELIKNL